MAKTFYEYFKESMESLGLPAPDSLFGTLGSATGTIAAIEGAITRLGAGATAAEVLGTATGGALAADLTAALTGVSAAFYAGACVGALIYASMMSMEEHVIPIRRRVRELWSSNDAVWQVVHKANAMGIPVNSDMLQDLNYQVPRRRRSRRSHVA
jgi:hypothetical protein